MTRVLVDIGAFIALRRSKDRNHELAVQTLSALIQRGVRLVSTNYTFREPRSTITSASVALP